MATRNRTAVRRVSDHMTSGLGQTRFRRPARRWRTSAAVGTVLVAIGIVCLGHGLLHLAYDFFFAALVLYYRALLHLTVHATLTPDAITFGGPFRQRVIDRDEIVAVDTWALKPPRRHWLYRVWARRVGGTDRLLLRLDDGRAVRVPAPSAPRNPHFRREIRTIKTWAGESARRGTAVHHVAPESLEGGHTLL